MDEAEGSGGWGLLIDATALRPFLRDMAPNATKGYRKEREGLAEVISEIAINQPSLGGQAGVTEADVQELVEDTQALEEINRLLGPARKLVELLEENRARLDHERHQVISAIATMVRTRAKRRNRESLLASYEKTLRYSSAIANKGAKTRRRNAAAKGKAGTSQGQ